MSDIYIGYGTDLIELTQKLMSEAKVSDYLKHSMRVLIKPNLVVAKHSSGGATTHSEIVEGIIVYLKDFGVRDIVIAEGSWLGETIRRAFDICGYTALGKKHNVKLLDTKTDGTVSKKSRGLDLEICKSALEADYFINVPVLKGHCQTKMTCCLKNLKGCIPDGEKRRFHALSLDRPIAALADALRPDLHIVDSVCGDLSFEEGGNPIEADRVMLGFDPVLLDSYGAELMGYDPLEIEHLRLAREYGLGSFAGGGTRITEINAANKPHTSEHAGAKAQGLKQHIEENQACSACVAGLIFALYHGTKYVGGKIHVGQGFRGKTAGGVGVGNCCAGFSRYIKGCPPKATDIMDFLADLD